METLSGRKDPVGGGGAVMYIGLLVSGKNEPTYMMFIRFPLQQERVW